MKYVLLFVLAIILIRIDHVIELGEKAVALFRSEPPQDRPEDLGEPPVIVRSEKNVTLTPRQQFLAFMENFRVSPDSVFREQAMSLFREHPQMFTPKLDKDFEGRLYGWRDLIIQNDENLSSFLVDLMSIMKGDNRHTVMKFFSIVMDLNFDMFMNSYPLTKEPTCAPATMLEAAVPAEEKIPELQERVKQLEEFLAKENLAPDKKLYATLCLNSLNLFLAKEAPPQVPPEGEASPEAGTSP